MLLLLTTQMKETKYQELRSIRGILPLRLKLLAILEISAERGKLSYFRYCLPLLDETQTAYQPQHPIPEKLKEKAKTEINNWRALGRISNNQSGFNIPLWILKKEDNSIRISLNARELN